MKKRKARLIKLHQHKAKSDAKRFQKSLFKLLSIICLSLIVLPIANKCYSQIEVLTTENGLPFRDVTSVTQDNLGFMWFGTTQGLLKYDGYSFEVYNNDPSNPNFIEKELLTDNNTIYRDSGYLCLAENMF